MESKNITAAQPAAGAKNAAATTTAEQAKTAATTAKATTVAEQAKTTTTAKATTAAEQAKAPKPEASQAAKSIEQLIKERAEQVCRQAELVGYREILISTKSELEGAAKLLANDLAASEFCSKVAKITVEVGDSYRSAEKLVITNPALIVGFIERIGKDVDGRIAEVERLLMA
jgi:hypothetical protein